MAKVTTSTLEKMRVENEPITMLTCTDASFAGMLDAAEIDMFLIGDSLGMVVQGENSTLGVTMDDMVYHTRCVAKATTRALIVGDMPFGSYQQSSEQAFENAVELMAAGAHMVKLEGGQVMAETVNFLVERGIPVCGHIGLTPQSVHALGGFKVQGKTEEATDNTGTSLLSPTDGYNAIGAAAIYTLENGTEITVGVNYSMVGDKTVTSSGVSGLYDDNTVVTSGIKVAYNF